MTPMGTRLWLLDIQLLVLTTVWHREYSTSVNGERFTGLNFHGFHPIKFGKLSRYLTLKTLKQYEACINID